MPVFIIVNSFVDVTHRQTTSLLAASARRLGQVTVLAEVTSVTAKSDGNGTEFSIRGIQLPKNAKTSKQVEGLTAAPPSSLKSFILTSNDTVLVRTNPGRDPSRRSLHESFIHLMLLAESGGITVINRPGNLLKFACKSSLLMLDSSFRPGMIVTCQSQDVVEFVRAAPAECVIKPLIGSRGNNVLRVSSDNDDLPTLLSGTYADQQVVAQHFVAANHPGDRRIVVLDGEILESEHGIAGIERHPATGDFRGNLHTGGTAHALCLNDTERRAVSRAAKLLLEHGIRLAGIDMVGEKIIEFNVFSSGGLYDGNRFASTDYSETIIRSFLD